MSKKNVLESARNHNDTYGTPQAAIDLTRHVLGDIDWDPCGNPTYPLYGALTTLLPIYEGLPLTSGRPASSPAAVFYGDSLVTPALRAMWGPQVRKLVNPPWSDIGPWVDKLEGSEAFAFVGPARVNSGWFFKLRRHARHIWFPSRRFVYKGAKTQPPFYSFMAFRGPSGAELHKAICQFFPNETDPYLVQP